MTSPFGRGQFSPPPLSNTVRYRSLNQVSQLLPIPMEAKENGLLTNNEQQSTGPPATQMTNQFQQLQVHADASCVLPATPVPARRALSQPTATRTNRFERLTNDFENDAELMPEDLLFERLKQVVNEFMVQFNGRFDCNSVMHWKIDYVGQIHYSVVISIDQPSLH